MAHSNASPDATASFPLIFFVAFVAAATALAAADAPSALAAGNAPDAPSLSELRERERSAEEHRGRELRSLEQGVAAGAVDPDAASDRRFRIEQAYRRELDALGAARDQALQGLEAQVGRKRGAGGTNPKGASSALPRIPSQSVIMFPGADAGAEAPSDGEPAREGRQKNVGFGTRELEF